MRWLAVAALLLCVADGAAITIVVGNTPTRVSLRVGSPGGQIDLVTFTIPAANVGDGVPITGTVPPQPGLGALCPANTVYVEVEGRASPANSRTVTLAVDSSTPLSNGIQTIPFTQIDWISTGLPPVTVPSGTFSGGAGQVLVSFQNSRVALQCLQFRYLNQNVVGAGTYSGRVVYGVTMP
jgi:hypothetical protein